MPSAKQFTEDEVMKILKLLSEGKTQVQIADEMNRTQRVICKILKKSQNWHPIKRSGRPKVTTDRDDRRILLKASSQMMSSAQIKEAIGIKASSRTIRRRLHSSKNFKFTKMVKKPILTAKHKQARLEWAKEVMCYSNKWNYVVFSDEKKFNVDGPDGWRCYWHDLRKEPRTFYSRTSGGGSVMVWGGFCANGKTSLAIIKGRQNSTTYQNTLEQHLLPFVPQIGSQEWIFQQDNASFHTSASTNA